MAASRAMTPEWLPTISAPESDGTFSSPVVSTLNQERYSGRISARKTLSVSSGSKPKSSTP